MGMGGGDIHEEEEQRAPAIMRSPADLRRIFDAHGEFVWRALARSGVWDADLRDATQEVFIVVARKLDEHDGSSSLTTWLYGIAIRVAANYRRKAHRRYEELTDAPSDVLDTAGAFDDQTPEAALARAQGRERLALVLEALRPEQRIVFTMFELDEMTCPVIAESLGIPLGTVYTRLRAARAAFELEAQKLDVRTSDAPKPDAGGVR